MKKTKKIIVIFVTIIFLVFVGYFIHCCSGVQDSNVSREYFNGKEYISSDNTFLLSFKGETVKLQTKEGTLVFDTVAYADGLFTLSALGEQHIFIVSDKTQIFYSTKNKILYQVRGGGA